MDLRTLADWVVRPRLLQDPRHRRGHRHGRRPQAVPGAGRSRHAARVRRLAAGGRGGAQGQQPQHQRRLRSRRARPSGRSASSAGSGPLPQQVLADLRKVPVKTNADRGRPARAGGPRRGRAGAQARRRQRQRPARRRPHRRQAAARRHPRADRRRSRRRCARPRPSLPADVVINTDLFQLKNFIDRGIYNVGEALVIGAVLVAHHPVPVPAELPHDVHHADGHPAVAGHHDAGLPARSAG